MVALGRVQNGVIVLSGGVQLPEGQEVAILAPNQTADSPGAAGSHSILDIPTISVGQILQPLTADDDLLGEMLEDRP